MTKNIHSPSTPIESYHRAMNDFETVSDALSALLSLLPLHAEEGTMRESVEEACFDLVLAAAGVEPEAARMAIGILRRQFEALALLDRTELACGRWSFVSFPASLLGRSLMETLAAPTQLLVPSNYWEQGEHRDASVKEEQRRLLCRIESERLRLNDQARPIRVVHVAWAFVRVGNQFLLHRREDIDRKGEKTHVLPGGRFNCSDLPSHELAIGPNILRQLFDVNSRLVDACLDQTLVRELDEELGLRHHSDYEFSRWQRLSPYRQISGAGNRYAYTEYVFQLYTLKLTETGEVRLLDREAESNTLVWFSMSELVNSRRADGTSAYIDVLNKAWGDGLSSQLDAVSDSRATEHVMRTPVDMLDLPDGPAASFYVGKTGKERAVDVPLTDDEWKCLLLLAWHTRGFPVDADISVRLLGMGWLAMTDDDSLALVHRLQAKLCQASLILIEVRDKIYVRMSIAPEILMIGAGMFSYRLEEDGKGGGVLIVRRDAVSTQWGRIGDQFVKLPIKLNTLKILRALENRIHPDSIPGLFAESWQKNLRDQLLPSLQLAGLRKLWMTENNVSSFVSEIRRMTC